MDETTNFATYPSLRGRVVVVTGGASGIGEAIVEAFAQQHATVVFLDIQDEAAAQLIQRIAAAGLPIPQYFRCDLTNVDLIKSTTAAIVQEFQTIDILVNNAANDIRHSIEEVTSDSWDHLIATNLKSQFFMAQGVIPVMRKAAHGCIINMSSIAYLVPSTGMPVYAAAKAGIVGLTRTLAHELGQFNIRVNAILPGAIETERQKRLWLTEEYRANVLARQALKRMIQPVEVARLVLFLASEDSSAITNQSYLIDAGFM